MHTNVGIKGRALLRSMPLESLLAGGRDAESMEATRGRGTSVHSWCIAAGSGACTVCTYTCPYFFQENNSLRYLTAWLNLCSSQIKSWSACQTLLTKEYEILRSPGSGASLLRTGQVYNYCAMRGICLLNRAISPTFLPLYPGHSSTTPT